MKNIAFLSRQSAFTMVELLISLTIGVFLLSGVLLFLLSNTSIYMASTQLSQVQDAGRAAAEMIAESHRLSGYMGFYSKMKDPATRVIEGTSTNADTCNTGGSTWVRMMDQPVFGLNNTDSGYQCLSGTTYIDSDVLTVRHASTVEATTLQNEAYYIRSALNRAVIFKGEDESSVDMLGEKPFNTFEAIATSYFVGESSQTCNGETVPSLFRVSTDSSGQPVVQELVPGIEKLEAEYLLSDGSYKSANQIALNQWQDVEAIKFWVIARSPCANRNMTNDRVYDLPSGPYPASPDNYFRQMYTRNISFRNLSS